MEQFSREVLLIGIDGVHRLLNSHVAVFGIGGVGSFVCEALARAGVGAFTLVDNDIVALSNINRQSVALHSTLGQLKTSVMSDRIRDINPNAQVFEINTFYLPENADELPLDKFDYIIDCVDTVSAKLSLAEHANRDGVPIISCMGTGNKLEPKLFEITDLYKTSVCPLARVMRRECKARGIDKLTVLYSSENPIKTNSDGGVPGSISYVPSSAGLMIAGYVIKELSAEK